MHEAAPELREIGAGVALHPNAVRVLRMIGVEDACAPGRRSFRVIGDPQLEDRTHHLEDQPLAAGGNVRSERRDGPPRRSARRDCGRASCGKRHARDALYRRRVARRRRGRAVRGRPRGRGGRGRHRSKRPAPRHFGNRPHRRPPRRREPRPCLAAVAGVADVLAARSTAACKRTRAVARVGGAATGADAPVAARWDDEERSRRMSPDCCRAMWIRRSSSRRHASGGGLPSPWGRAEVGRPPTTAPGIVQSGIDPALMLGPGSDGESV